MKLFKQKSFLLALLGILLLYNLLALWTISGPDAPQRSGTSPASYPEIKDLENRQLTFQELSDYFTALAENKGAEYAYNVLKAAPIPPGTDMHLLGHAVGDALYKQEGSNGIQICTQDFRNACSHSIVVGLFFDKGVGALPDIARACREAPGGSGAYTMCFHGLGHGILAYTGYEMERTIELCQKTGTPAYNDREYVECVGGSVMEIIGGGFHDPALWEVQSKKYLPPEEPLAPCSSDFMPEAARPQCYVYLTPRLFKVAGADLGNPTPENYENAFLLCDGIPKTDVASRSTCYGGFGKEFIVLAQNRDIRKIDQLNDDQLAKVYEWCLLAKNTEGTRACLLGAVNSIYWGGENDRHASIRFCGIMKEQNYKDACFQNLIGAVSFYIKDQGYKKEFCEELPTDYQKNCRQMLSRAE